jgi:hypothetical protein
LTENYHPCWGAVARGLSPRHEPFAFSRRRWRDALRKTWWIGCAYCRAESGPYRHESTALKLRDAHYTFVRAEMMAQQ